MCIRDRFGDDAIVRRSLGAAIPTVIRVAAVGVVIAVCEVVLVVVRNQIVERKSVVASDKINALSSRPIPSIIQIGAPRDTISKLHHGVFVALDKAADLSLIHI